MRIGVIGAGRLGGTLAAWCAESGHDVAVTSRHPEQLRELVDRMNWRMRVMPVPEAASFGEMVIFAPNWASAKEAVDLTLGGIEGKVVIDATNPADPVPGAPGPGGLAGMPGVFSGGGGFTDEGASSKSSVEVAAAVTGPPGEAADRMLARAGGKSGLETLIEWAPEAHWVKAFNTIPAEVLNRRRGHDPLLAEFVCTDQPDARAAASRIIRELGFAPFYAGGAKAARLTETGGPLQSREVDVQDATDVLAEALTALR
ncbi:NADPH-dependent F420 reductase [Actinoplanes aureus]|jgi:predicted dinucleotide-binding enzyme|uniref:NAD(P)-binding domain-containing protein n=1 Tax=Actinoplanes aureus TaxID=2792083 RepID=A0A931C5Y5_9ACTN|nr:NAD(P)-binding domain-containing protein [Actinoplanes aureus]